MWRGYIRDAVPKTSYVNIESERPLIDTEIGCMVLARDARVAYCRPI